MVAWWSETFWHRVGQDSFLVNVVQKLSKLIKVHKNCCKMLKNE